MKQLRPPLTDEAITQLKVGDEVQITGLIYSARDMAHKKMCGAIEAGEELPFDIKGAIVYFVGPSPARPGKVIGAAGPTTSSRMDPFSPTLLAAGLKAMLGKGYRNQQVRGALKKYKAVHLLTIGGAGALLSKFIKNCRVIGYDDLGTEAIRELVVENFPAIVAYDSEGNSVYKR